MSTDGTPPLFAGQGGNDAPEDRDEFPVDTSAMADMFGGAVEANHEPSIAAEPAEESAPAAELAPEPIAIGAGGAAWGLCGHDEAVDALRRAIASGHLAHAYLFVGPKGVGKETLAWRLAQTLVSPRTDDPTVPDRTTKVAMRLESGSLPDVDRIATRGLCDESGHDHEADNSVGIRICQIRRMERLASMAPYASSRRVFIIDSADDLQLQAAHALLKTLEEPPAGVLILLLARDPDALLPTIRSRCQEVILRPLPREALQRALIEHGGVSPEAAPGLARLARGRYGLAMQMHADPSMAVLRESAVEQMQELVAAGRNERFDVAERLGGAWYRERESVLTTIDLWRDWWRDVLLVSSGVESEPLPEVASVAASCTPAAAVRGLQAVQTAREHLLANTNAQLALEVMMLDLPVLERREGRVPVAP
jgi:DNA polymerase III subunit delta'